MKINIYVKIKSKVEGVEQLADGSYVIRVNARPVEGEANSRVLELIANYFKVSKKSVTIVSGHASKRKIIEICI